MRWISWSWALLKIAWTHQWWYLMCLIYIFFKGFSYWATLWWIKVNINVTTENFLSLEMLNNYYFLLSIFWGNNNFFASSTSVININYHNHFIDVYDARFSSKWLNIIKISCNIGNEEISVYNFSISPVIWVLNHLGIHISWLLMCLLFSLKLM